MTHSILVQTLDGRMFYEHEPVPVQHEPVQHEPVQHEPVQTGFAGEVMSRDVYGYVDGPRSSNIAEAIKTDPLESMLGVCRVLGLDYEIRQLGYKWSVRLTPVGHWPADFYTGSGKRDGVVPSYCVVNCDDRLEGLRKCLCMVVEKLRDSCAQWRGIVSRVDAYKHWFPAEVAEREAATRAERLKETPRLEQDTAERAAREKL